MKYSGLSKFFAKGVTYEERVMKAMRSWKASPVLGILGMGAFLACMVIVMAMYMSTEHGPRVGSQVGHLDGYATQVDKDGWVVQLRDDLVRGPTIKMKSAMHEGVAQTYAEIQFSYMDTATVRSCVVPTPPEVEKFLRSR